MRTRAEAVVFLYIVLASASAAAAEPPVLWRVPESSKEKPGEAGVVAHTNHAIAVRPEAGAGAPSGETPASLACVYKTAPLLTPNCPKTASVVPAGGFGTIAIVDAYDYPTAEADLGVFSAKFGLPACTKANGCFSVVYAGGNRPGGNCGWAQEAALDIEWAHAMAPGAAIILVEARSNSLSDLMAAVDAAGARVTAGGGTGQVSMSWGSSEFFGETASDPHFQAAGVVYFASSGDTGGKRIYPGVSPYVVSAGGTSLVRASNGNFSTENAWSGSGGGPSQFESRPAYQDALAAALGLHRGSPDMSFDADPNTGVSVYDGTVCSGQSGWMVFGGTSVAAPSLAGIVNLAGGRATTTAHELATVYGNLPATSARYAADFRDIKSGRAGTFSAGTGWDFVTGMGSPLGLSGK